MSTMVGKNTMYSEYPKDGEGSQVLNPRTNTQMLVQYTACTRDRAYVKLTYVRQWTETERALLLHGCTDMCQVEKIFTYHSVYFNEMVSDWLRARGLEQYKAEILSCIARVIHHTEHSGKAVPFDNGNRTFSKTIWFNDEISAINIHLIEKEKDGTPEKSLKLTFTRVVPDFQIDAWKRKPRGTNRVVQKVSGVPVCELPPDQVDRHSVRQMMSSITEWMQHIPYQYDDVVGAYAGKVSEGIYELMQQLNAGRETHERL
jgi:hypothetical protein